MKSSLSITLAFFTCLNFAFSQQNIFPSQERLEAHLVALSKFGTNPQGGVSRLGFSDAAIQARQFVKNLMEEAGLDVHIDAAGNIIGKRRGKNANLPPIVFGSHIDSVPFGGNYDGDVGVMAAIECIDMLNDLGRMTEHPLEVIVFCDEEGGLTGSQGMIGTLKAGDLNRITNCGKTIRQGIIDIGGNPDQLESAIRKKGELAAFLEVHIEQGAILDSKGLNIGVVEGIVGIEEWDITVLGKANHAGTTPMNIRRDALLAAAKLVIAVNETVRSIPGTQVGTVGIINAEPGAPNVIPGKVTMSLELRDLSREKMFSIFEKIQQKAKEIEKQTGTKIDFKSRNLDIIPALADKKIQGFITSAAKESGLSFQSMPSFAGHDSQDMAKIAPMGMIFVPSKGGISHAPDEFTPLQDIANGTRVLFHTILKIDEEN